MVAKQAMVLGVGPFSKRSREQETDDLASIRLRGMVGGLVIGLFEAVGLALKVRGSLFHTIQSELGEAGGVVEKGPHGVGVSAVAAAAKFE